MRGKMSRRTRFAIAAFCDSLSWPSSCWPLIRQGVPLAACAMTAAFAMAQPLPLPREEPLAPLQLPATTRAVLAPPSEDGSDAAFPVGAPSDSDTATALTAEEVTAGRARLRCAETPVAWCSGGIGAEERAALRAEAWRVCVEFALHSREYLSDVQLTVWQENAEVLRADAVGPWWCARLPPGTYRLQATAPGKGTQSRFVTVPAAGAPVLASLLW